MTLLTILGSNMVLAGTNGYLLNCFCAKSYARGGTVVAIPDNSSVILANPAGLAFIPRRAVGIGLGLLIPKVQFENDLNSNLTAKDKIYPMPFSGYVDPRPGSSWAWGFGLNVVGGMGAEYELNHDIFRNYNPTSPDYGQLEKQNYFSKFGYVKAGPAMAYRINENMSVGAGVQLYYGMLDFRMPFSIDPVANMKGIADPINNITFGQMFAAPHDQGGFGYNEVTAYADMHDLTGFGFGANIGFFYKINEKWSIGVAYTAPTTMYLEGKAEMDMTAQFNKAFGDAVAGYMAQNPSATQADAQAAVGHMFTNMGIDLTEGVATSYAKNKADFDVPQKLAAGLAYKPTPKWTFGLDVEYIDWKNAFDNLPIQLSGGNNHNINLMINGNTEDGTFDYKFPLNWKNVVNLKFGADYLLQEGVNLRAGYIHGANPVPSSTVFSIFPAIVEDHITLGGGYSFNDRFTLDVAWIYSLNKKINGSTTGHLIGNEYNGSVDQLQENLIVTSLSIGL